MEISEEYNDATPIFSSGGYLENLRNIEDSVRDEDLPSVTIVIPTNNAAELISATLDSVLTQRYPSFEVIIIDSSIDRTLEIVKGYKNDRIRVYSVTQSHFYEMLNKGLSQTHGTYVNFLFPGDYYICQDTLRQMMSLALQNDKPNLVYCGTLLRDGKSEVKILYRDLSIDLLKKGLQPTSLQSCWFRTDSLREMGKFNPSYNLRGGFELMCRFCMQSHFRFISKKRVLTDYDLRAVTRRMVVTHFWETMRTVYHYFGLLTTLRWLIHQRDTQRFVKLWLRSLKVAFSGR